MLRGLQFAITLEEKTIVKLPTQAPNDQEGPRVNLEIESRTIRLVNAEGEMVGIVSIRDGLNMAAEAGLDLVEVSPNADPPVCKILDYGKFKYEAQKKRNEARKKQKVIEVKEIKLRPNIDDNDYAVKMRAMRKFIQEGDKVKITLRFRGREMAHQDIGIKLLERTHEDIGDLAKIEQIPKMEGRQMIMVIAPR